jgi:chaperonin GroEL
MVKVGSIIESELQEKIDRVDDAVCAVRSAKEEGVVAGGGVALFSASSILICNSDIASLSLVAPLNKILLNASVKSDAKIGKYPFGYDVKNFKEVNMIEVGIVDATKAIKHALTNAISASNTLLMSDHVITNKRNNG